MHVSEWKFWIMQDRFFMDKKTIPLSHLEKAWKGMKHAEGTVWSNRPQHITQASNTVHVVHGHEGGSWVGSVNQRKMDKILLWGFEASSELCAEVCGRSAI